MGTWGVNGRCVRNNTSTIPGSGMCARKKANTARKRIDESRAGARVVECGILEASGAAAKEQRGCKPVIGSEINDDCREQDPRRAALKSRRRRERGEERDLGQIEAMHRGQTERPRREQQQE